MKCIIAFFCFFISLNLSAQQVKINAIGFELKPDEEAKIQRLVSYEIRIFNGLFKTFKNDSLVLHLNLFAKRRDFKYQLDQFGLKGLTESGFYSARTNQSYVRYDGIENLRTILHEISHALLNQNSKKYPRWFTEGLAQFLESLEEKNFNIQITANFRRIEDMKFQYQPKKKLKIEDFINDNSGWRDKNNIQQMYTTAYCVIYYVYKKNPENISKIALMLKKGEPQLKIFDSLFGSFQNFNNGFFVFYR